MYGSKSHEKNKENYVLMHLVEPFQKMDENFSALRSELERNNIPYIKHFGFEKVK